MKNQFRFQIMFILVLIFVFFVSGCGLHDSGDDIYELTVLSGLPDSATVFCENNIPLSGGYQMVMCKDTSDPLGYSAFIKDRDGMYTKVNLLIPDNLEYDSVKLLPMPSGGGGSGEDTLYLELTIGDTRKYVFFTTTLFASDYWWNYEYQGEAPYTAQEIEQYILENEMIKEQAD